MSEAVPWAAQAFRPFDRAPGVVFARAAARSALFQGTAGDGVVVGSAAGADAQDTATRARGELIERMGNIVAGRRAEADRVVVATYRALHRAGRVALDPAALVHDASTADDARDAVGLWVEGHSLPTGRDVLVPADAVYLRHRPPPGCGPVGVAAGSTGVAAHPDEASAAEHAVWEILERDLIRRSWYGDAVSPAIEAPPALGEPLARLGLESTALLLPAPAGAACVVVAVHAPDRTGQTFGARCGPAGHLPALTEKATYEALMVRWTVHLPVARRTWARWAGATPPRTALEHALWAYHRQDSLGIWPTDPRPPPVSSAPPAADPATLLAAHTGEDVIAVPTPSPQAKESGLHVVRVIAPGTRALPSRSTGPRPHPFG